MTDKVDQKVVFVFRDKDYERAGYYYYIPGCGLRGTNSFSSLISQLIEKVIFKNEFDIREVETNITEEFAKQFGPNHAIFELLPEEKENLKNLFSLRML